MTKLHSGTMSSSANRRTARGRRSEHEQRLSALRSLGQARSGSGRAGRTETHPWRRTRGVGATGGTQGSGGDALHPVGATGGTQVGDTGCTQNRSPVDSHRNSPPIPPAGQQQHQGVLLEASPPAVSPDPTPESADEDPAQTLA